MKLLQENDFLKMVNTNSSLGINKFKFFLNKNFFRLYTKFFDEVEVDLYSRTATFRNDCNQYCSVVNL